MPPQLLSTASSKLYQYFQDLDHDDSQYSRLIWTYTQSTHDHPIKCLEPLKDGHICLADDTGSIFTGHPHQLNQIHTATKSESSISHLAVDLSCHLLAGCSKQSKVNLIELCDSGIREKKLSFAESIHCSAFYSDELNGCTVLIGGGMTRVWLMDVEMGKVFQKFGDWRLHSKKVVGVMRAGNGCLLMSQHADRSLEVWDLRMLARPVWIVKPLLDSAGPITCTSHVDNSGRLLARAESSGKIQVEELLTGKLVSRINTQDKVAAVRFAQTGCYLLVAGLDKQYVYEISNIGHRFKTIGKVEKTTKIRWISDKEEFVSLSNGNCVNYFQLVNNSNII